MKLRIGATETLLLAAGLAGLLEQEVVRVIFRINPSALISGICFAFVLIGTGVAAGRNFKIGPVEVHMKDQAAPPGQESTSPVAPPQSPGPDQE